MSHSAQRIIESRRRQDEGYRAMNEVTAYNQRLLHVANFEIATSGKIERRNKQDMFKKQKLEYSDALLGRRRQLADLYNEEMENWKLEALSRVETMEERKAGIMERAYNLRDARNREREEYVRAAYDRQWRDACDDARTLDSKALTAFMSQQRMSQIKAKMANREELSKAEKAFAEAWRRQLAETEARENAKQDRRRDSIQSCERDIKEQIRLKEILKEEEHQKQRQDDEEELRTLRLAIEADEAEQRCRQEEAYRLGRAVREDNESHKEMLVAEAEEQRRRDVILLEYALRKENAAKAAEEAKRQGNKDAAIKYRKYLDEQMIREAEDTAFMDDVCKQEEERVWKARDDVLQARDDARRDLMRFVDEGRQEQIRKRREELIREREHDRVFAEKFLVEAKRSVEEEQAEQRRRREQNIESKEKLKAQIELRKHKAELEAQEAYLQDMRMKQMERMHQKKLAEQGGEFRLHYPVNHTKWYS